MARISLVTGGANSGKSKFAEDLCLGLEPGENGEDKVLYIASAKILDGEMAEKKARHIERRKTYSWDTLEAYRDFDKHFDDQSIFDKGYKAILFDCLTMMVTNILFEGNMDFDASDRKLRQDKEDIVFKELDKLLDLVADKDLDIVFVTNELGMPGRGHKPIQVLLRNRRQGQYVHSRQESGHVFCGIGPTYQGKVILESVWGQAR